jgi:hypothetical protein
MVIEAPICKFKKTNLKIYIAIWCAYDGYLNDKWIEEHTDANGNPKAYLVVNRKAPPFLIGAAVLLGVYLFAIRKKKLIADEDKLILEGKAEIKYDSIQKVDKTNFDTKGFFLITYKDAGNAEKQLKLSNKRYDNLKPVLEKVIDEIS